MLTEIDDSVTLYHDEGRLTLEFRLTFKDAPMRLARDPQQTVAGGWVLSISGSTPTSGGQIIEDALRLANALGLPMLRSLCGVWLRHHLNDMHAGTNRQRGIAKGKSYAEAIKALAKAGLEPDRGYHYGSAWLYSPLPDNLPDVWHATKAEIEAHNAARVAETGDIYRNE